MRTTGYRTMRYGTPANRIGTRSRDQRIGYLRLVLLCVTTAGSIGLGVGLAGLDRPLAGRHCSVPNTTVHDATGLTLSCSPAGSDDAVWQYAPAS